MARIKLTKNELKTQRDTLRRYERYLPTLQLKQQQLQQELRGVDQRLEANVADERAAEHELAPWVALFADDLDFGAYLRVRALRTDVANVAGVNIPVLRELEFERIAPDRYATPAWLDDGCATLERLATLRAERVVLDEQRRRLAEELRITSQRVNLFERVKIPESRGHIRVIRIALGDLQTLDVARSKIAKRKALERETER